jgi:hypothetical protein
LKFITPSDDAFTAGTSFFPSSFAQYFSFCAYELLAAARTKEPNATAITIIHTVRAFSMFD